MIRALPLFAGLAGAFMSTIGLMGPAALVVGLAGGALLLTAPFLGALGLVTIAHLDGITTTLIDPKIPMSVFKLLTAGTLAMILLHARVNPLLHGRPRPSAPLLATMLFACWLAFTHLISGEMDAGRDHTVGFLMTLLIVAITCLTVHSPRHLHWMALAMVMSGAISAVLVILEAKFGTRLIPVVNPEDIAAWQGEVRPAGASAYNPTTASHLMLASLTLAATLALTEPRWRLIWACAALICLAALGLMGARSAFLGLGVAILFIGWHLRRHRYFLLAVIGAMFACIAALPFLPDALTERFTAVFEMFDGGNTSDRTLLRRLSYNIIGLELWSRDPIFGIGPGVFPSYYAGPEFRWFPGRELDPRQLHNSYMEVLTETGIIGLGLFLTAVFGAVHLALRAQIWRNEAAIFATGFGIALAAFLTASLFMPNEDNKYLWILVALCCRAATIAKKEPPQ